MTETVPVRRRLLLLLVMLLAASVAIAGCTGEDEGDGQDDTGDEQGGDDGVYARAPADADAPTQNGSHPGG